METANATSIAFERAAEDIGVSGDNDTLPFDIDTRFVKERGKNLAKLAHDFCTELEAGTKEGARKSIDALPVFSERLLAPAGPAGFRTVTKIHPFWNLYFNGLGVLVAERLEPTRSPRAHSYRFLSQGTDLFDRSWSWRHFREATATECHGAADGSVVVQTDIASFYEHVSHHRLENVLDDLFPAGSTVPAQIDRFLNKFAAGRSFGLPVGGQCSRCLAEALLWAVDRRLSDERIVWRRFVDDFVLIAANQADAYRALAVVSNALADYGLSLNRTKTTILTAKHYVDYVGIQLRGAGDATDKLLEIDLHFDPYSDNPKEDYEELREVIGSLDVRVLLDLELHKAQPDPFVVAQIGRTLKLHDPSTALALCRTLLSKTNLHAFRASWSTVMRGVSSVRADTDFASIFEELDKLLDDVPTHSPHLLRAETSCLHYLRSIRFHHTQSRAEYLLALYSSSNSDVVRRACIDCWRQWKDRFSFTRERNRWNALSAETQRMLWAAAPQFGDEGLKFRSQVKRSALNSWKLGIERQGKGSFASTYIDWAENGL